MTCVLVRRTMSNLGENTMFIHCMRWNSHLQSCHRYFEVNILLIINFSSNSGTLFIFQVCSSCNLRSSCEKAYLLPNKGDEAGTIDVMRVLLTYGFDPVNGSVTNKSLLKQKSVKNVVRKLLHEVVKLSAVPIDPNLPRPVIKIPPPKVKQPPPPPKKRVGRDDIEMKKGDWLCPKYVFPLKIYGIPFSLLRSAL